MGIIQKADVTTAYIKMGLYGCQGVGKTRFAVKFAEYLASLGLNKVVVFDTEKGSAWFANPDSPFGIVESRSLDDLRETIEEAEEDKYDVLVIDSMTHIWEQFQEDYIEELKKSSNPKKKRRGLNGDIQFQDWRFIKKSYSRLMRKLIDMPMHVIIIGREGNVYDKDERGNLVVVDNKMKAESDTPYEPHILVNMYTELDKNGDLHYYSFVEKDRSDTIHGLTIEDPDEDDFKPLLKKLGKVHEGTKAGHTSSIKDIVKDEDPDEEDIDEDDIDDIDEDEADDIDEEEIDSDADINIREIDVTLGADELREEIADVIVEDICGGIAENAPKALAMITDDEFDSLKDLGKRDLKKVAKAINSLDDDSASEVIEGCQQLDFV
jgi:hypothetical protein